MTKQLKFQTVDVFTDHVFGGNPLAVFTDARDIGDADLQKIAAEMNYSETTFILPPDDPRNAALSGKLKLNLKPLRIQDSPFLSQERLLLSSLL